MTSLTHPTHDLDQNKFNNFGTNMCLSKNDGKKTRIYVNFLKTLFHLIIHVHVLLSCFILAVSFWSCGYQYFIFYNEAYSIHLQNATRPQRAWEAPCIHNELQHLVNISAHANWHLPFEFIWPTILHLKWLQWFSRHTGHLAKKLTCRHDHVRFLSSKRILRQLFGNKTPSIWLLNSEHSSPAHQHFRTCVLCMYTNKHMSVRSHNYT